MSISVEQASTASLLLGIIGDIALNYLTRFKRFPDVGLRSYFALHGPVESVMIAGGLMFVSMFVALNLLKLSSYNTVSGLFVIGIVIDLLFRYLRIMPSLDGMYKSLNVIHSALWAGGPLVASYILGRYMYNR
jgi:hypothetical protein